MLGNYCKSNRRLVVSQKCNQKFGNKLAALIVKSFKIFLISQCKFKNDWNVYRTFNSFSQHNKQQFNQRRYYDPLVTPPTWKFIKKFMSKSKRRKNKQFSAEKCEMTFDKFILYFRRCLYFFLQTIKFHLFFWHLLYCRNNFLFV